MLLPAVRTPQANGKTWCFRCVSKLPPGNTPETRAIYVNPSFHPGRCAAISMNGVHLGYMGQVHPLVAKNYGLDAEVYCVELDFSKAFEMTLPEPTFAPLPKYPAVTRDLSLLCDEATTIAELSDTITAAGGKLLRRVDLFDIYRGKGVAEGKKSVAFSLVLRADDRTLTDADSEGVVSKVLAALESKLGAVLR